MSALVSSLRRRAPQLYRAAMLARGKLAGVRGASDRRAAERVLDGRDVCIEVAGDVGLGGLLTVAAHGLAVARRRGSTASLRLTTSLYMPAGQTTDWLGSYFVRHGRAAADGEPVVEAGALSQLEGEGDAEEARLLWQYMSIKPAIVASVEPFTRGRYAAVHFRGSDKYLEAPRVAEAKVLDAVSAEMQRTELDRVFIASDEQAFIDAAFSRFGDAAFALPQTAFAIDGRPPHFSSAAGEIKAIEALQTMLVLARAAAGVRTESLLSAWADTLAPSRGPLTVVRP